MDVFEAMLKPMKEFSKNSYRLVNKCRKPDARGAAPRPPPPPPPPPPVGGWYLQYVLRGGGPS